MTGVVVSTTPSLSYIEYKHCPTYDTNPVLLMIQTLSYI